VGAVVSSDVNSGQGLIGRFDRRSHRRNAAASWNHERSSRRHSVEKRLKLGLDLCGEGWNKLARSSLAGHLHPLGQLDRFAEPD
jgi:hypothetical protein